MIIIGLTGTIGAGKGTIVEFLVNQKGFEHYSVRAWLLEEIRKRGWPEDRDSMFNLANELRALHTASFVTDQLYDIAIKSGRNCVIESIRTPGEIDSLRKKKNFFLFAVDADPHLRYERIQIRHSETDNISFDEFRENETREMNSTDPNKQNLKKCIEMADYLFSNNSTREELFLHLEKVLGKIEGKSD
jgi:dephospho-CoA kinase